MSASSTSQPGYFLRYIDLVEEKDLTTAFANQSTFIKDFFPGISEEKSLHAYAEGKWTLREMLQHVIDAERIFSYRALCFARKETITLPGFEENDYADASEANNRSWESLTSEWWAVRKSTLLLFNSFTPEMLTRIGKASVNSLSVSDAGFLIVGHLKHHIRVIEERYL